MSLINPNNLTNQNKTKSTTPTVDLIPVEKNIIESKGVYGKKIDGIHHKLILPTQILLTPLAPKTVHNHKNHTFIDSPKKPEEQKKEQNPNLKPILATMPSLGSQRLLEFKLKIAHQKLQQEIFQLDLRSKNNHYNNKYQDYQPNFTLVGEVFDSFNAYKNNQRVDQKFSQRIKRVSLADANHNILDKDYNDELKNQKNNQKTNSTQFVPTVYSVPSFEDTPNLPPYSSDKNLTFGSTFIASNISNDLLSNPNKQKLNLSELGQEIKHHNIRAKIKSAQKIRKYSYLGTLVASAILFATLFLGYSNTASYVANNKQRTAAADSVTQTNRSNQTSPTDQKKLDYTNWITKQNNNKYAPASEDLDGDGLTNYEEFLLGSDPLKKNSCTPKSTDLENLVNLINPKTCVPIDFKNDAEVKKFSEVINIPQIQKELIKDVQTKFQTQSNEVNLLPKSVTKSFLDINNKQTISQISSQPTTISSQALSQNSSQNSSLAVSSLAPISTVVVSSQISSIISTSSVDSVVLSPSSQPTIINPSSSISSVATDSKTAEKVVQKVADYVQNYRSFDSVDSQVGLPIDPSHFVKVSQDYGVPLKYVLAMGRYESRYGTDQHNADGSLNRIGRHKNMFSIGLDDDGGSITYDTWEEGANAFGKWYKKFEDRGVSDCTKWRIYNPNGDYCQKIESLATQIDGYLKS